EVYAAILGAVQADAPPTVAEWAGQWIAHRRLLGDVQPDTITSQHRILIRWVLPYLGQMPLPAVSRERVEEWVRWLVRQPSRRGSRLDADTIRRAHSVLHSLLAAAVPRWLSTNPAARIPGQRRGTALPRATPHEPMFLTAAEVDMILAAC